MNKEQYKRVNIIPKDKVSVLELSAGDEKLLKLHREHINTINMARYIQSIKAPQNEPQTHGEVK